MKLVTVEQMQQIEKEADASGLTYAEMMENAGLGLAEAVMDAYSHLPNRRALGLVGSGNNGGDTLVALAHLEKNGWETTAYLVRPRPEADPLVERLHEAGGQVVQAASDDAEAGYPRLRELISAHSLLLDGVLGTGTRLPLKPEVGAVLQAVRQVVEGAGGMLSSEIRPQVVAVDCPSGIDLDTGEAAPETIPADLTVTMAAVKTGLLKLPAYGLAGALEVVTIGNLEPLASWQAVRRQVVDETYVRLRLPKRPLDAHKGTFGTVVVAAGSTNYTGAALLAGEAAYRIGAGLVTLAVPTPLYTALAGRLPEATWVLLPHDQGVIDREAAHVLQENLEGADALLLGCGFGQEDTTRDFLARLLGAAAHHARPGRMGFVGAAAGESAEPGKPLPPLVIDADGLKLLVKLPTKPGENEGEWFKRLPAMTVLTPHPGEMSALTGLPTSEIQADRIAAAERFAKEWGHVVVLKGAFTVIASPEGDSLVVPVASPALARAGTGDVLAGLITGLRAQGLDAFSAAAVGAWVHAQAGLRAAETVGHPASVLAGDVLYEVAGILGEL